MACQKKKDRYTQKGVDGGQLRFLRDTEKGMKKMIFKTSILQMRSRNRDIQNNISTVIEKMEEAKSNHADILLLPECFLTGYDLTIGNDAALVPEDLNPL